MLNIHPIYIILTSIYILFSSPCNAEINCNEKVFVCETNSPSPLSLHLYKNDKSYYLTEFKIDNNSLVKSGTPIQFEKGSYHRPLVDEHSLTFVTNQLSVTLSDHKSEEFGELETFFTVGVVNEGNQVNFTCDDGSYSNLSEIKDNVELDY